ncbi:hypothetical protein CDO73_03340 [Saccharibacillus sp. O23]|uniref:DUF4367 domain-containing protein n=1 Tax=Saccharibacillus sp. O23 TaxID=2009338 RepID=UPI000B4E0FB8|nr:DUF4367 domain-containing protein [Saccharibacillus sp. O23]OWR32647.1 hypothetical protein CDO73_03340 [Saccharibacillus sp. O23]
MNDEKFDELFDEAFERAVSSASPVDPESRRAAWERVQNRRKQLSGSTEVRTGENIAEHAETTSSKAPASLPQQAGQQQSFRRRYRRSIRMTGIAAGLILFGSVAFSDPVRTGALNPLYQKLYTWSTGEAVVVSGQQKPQSTEGALTPPPPEGIEKPTFESTEEALPEPEPGQIISSVHYEEQPVSLEEIKQRLAYPMPEFPRVPADLERYETTLSVPDDGSAPVSFTLRYKGENDRTLSIFVDYLNEDANRTYSFGIGKVTEIELDNGLEGQFVDREEGSEDLVHVIRGQIDILISGNLTRDELLQIAGHIVDGEPR